MAGLYSRKRGAGVSVSNALQAMVYQRLMSHGAVSALVGARIYDAPPLTAAYPFVSIGDGTVVPDDAECIAGRNETLQIDCWSNAQDGKREAKALVDAVKAALHGYDGTMATGALISIEVVLMRVMDDPDPSLKHGVIQIEALIEE